METPEASLPALSDNARRAEQLKELFDIFRPFIGEDLLTYKDREQAAAFSRRMLVITKLALEQGDVATLEQIPSLIRLVGESYGVVIARGKEKIVANRLQIIVQLIVRGAPLLL